MGQERAFHASLRSSLLGSAGSVRSSRSHTPPDVGIGGGCSLCGTWYSMVRCAMAEKMDGAKFSSLWSSSPFGASESESDFISSPLLSGCASPAGGARELHIERRDCRSELRHSEIRRRAWNSSCLPYMPPLGVATGIDFCSSLANHSPLSWPSRYKRNQWQY